MDIKRIKELLDAVAVGTKLPDEVMTELRDMPFSDLDFAKPDSHRSLRNGFLEVILCQGKRQEHILRIVEDCCTRNMNVLGTRAEADVGKAVCDRYPKADWDPVSRTFRLALNAPRMTQGKLSIVCAGTADVPVAEEARRTAEFFGVEAARYYDVGVAGLHRVLGCVNSIRESDAVIVCAGMEGALPSVMGGLMPVPIIAVPTSCGYGSNFGGLSALLGMLNSCSEGLTVVNIDNGFGAACAALRILSRLNEQREKTAT